MPTQSASIKAIKLTRAVFESIHGNIGLLKFNIEELTPTNGAGEEESKKWKIVCSFFETLGSSSPSRYEVNVDLEEGTVAIKKISEPDAPEERYKVARDNPSDTPPE